MNETTRQILEKALESAKFWLEGAVEKRENLKVTVLTNEDEILRLQREVKSLSETLNTDKGRDDTN